MASPALERLRASVAAMPPGTLVPRDWLLEQLTDGCPGTETPAVVAPAPATLVDLTIDGLARLFGKRPSTVRGWVEHGDFPGAYKLHGKEWRVPVSAVEAFQTRQRGTKSNSRLSAWRSVKVANQALVSESGPKAVKKRSPPGNAEV